MKKVRKLVPVSLCDIPGMEQWLEDMANEGLFPVTIGSRAVFREGGKPGTRFRLDAFGAKGTAPEPERLALYEEMGWEYVLSIGEAFHLFCSTDPSAPELHTDRMTQGQSLDRLAKAVRKSVRWPFIVLTIFLLGPLLAFALPASRFDVQPDRFAALPLMLLHMTEPTLLLCLSSLLFLTIPTELRNHRTMKRLHNNLKQGLPPPPSSGPSRRIAMENLATLLLLPVLLIAVFPIFTSNITGGNIDPAQNVPLSRFDRPHLTLAELEEEPLYTYMELFNEKGFGDDDNTADKEFSLLAPVWYTTSEEKHSAQGGTMANAFSPNPEGGRYRYSPDLDGAYFKLTIPAMARMVAESQLDNFRLVNLRWEYREVSHPGADFVILADGKDGLWQMAAVAKDGRVAVFRYAGQQRLEDHLDQLIQYVTD